jgi:predicted O-methyltransferase YrrM
MVQEAAVDLALLSPVLCRMLATIPGEISEREGLGLAWLASRVPAGQCIVEIGSYRGRSTCYLAEGALHSGRDEAVQVFAIDLWGEAPWPQYADPANYEAFCRAICALRLRDVVTSMLADSCAVGAAWAGPPIGLLFVDADHTFEAVIGDYHAWERHISPGGLLALHDAADPQWGVRRAIDDVIMPTGLWDPGPFITGDLATMVRRADP